MKRFVALCLVVLSVLAPASTSAWMPGWTPQSLASWVGCGEVEWLYLPAEPNAMFGVQSDPFSGMAPQPYIVLTDGLLAMPPEQIFIVALHELAHCVQWKQGILFGRTTVEVEQEADIMASNWACVLGHDGPAYERSFWDEIKRITGRDLDEGSLSHGSANERIQEIVMRAVRCWADEQAPKIM